MTNKPPQMKNLFFKKDAARRILLSSTLMLSVLFLKIVSSWAGNETIATSPATVPVVDFAQTTSLALTLLKVFGALILVVGLMVIFSFWLKKLGFSRAGLRQGTLIEVIDTKMIAPKKYISIVQIGNEILALGVTDQQITKLANLDDINLLPIKPTESKLRSPFSSFLSNALKSGEK